MKKHIKKLFIITLTLTILVSTQYYIFADEIDEENSDYVWIEQEILETLSNSTEEPILNSRYAVVFDRASKSILYGKEENKPVPMASTTKIMTAIVLMENLEKTGLTLDSKVKVNKEAALIGGSRLGLKTDDEITINDLFYGLMLCSGNDAAIQIALTISGSVEEFANLMNQKAEELGLKNTHFVTPHGLDNEAHYTTAHELALISDYALNIEKIKEVVKTKTYTVNINRYNKTITNTNELLGYLDGVNGVKTGFTNGAGRCLVTSVERNGFNIITVVLGADTKEIRTKDSIKLIEYIYSNYELVNLQEIIEKKFLEWVKNNKDRIIVNKGENKDIDIKLEDYLYKIYPIKKDKIKDINVEIEGIRTYFEAPLYKNTKIANINVKIAKEDLMNISILSNKDIQKKKVKDYFFECISILKMY